MSTASPQAALLETASKPYRSAGRFAFHFARGKLRADPVFYGILQRGLLQARNRILDLGCGQGLLTAWLRAARLHHEAGLWPQEWPAPPSPEYIAGIELKGADVLRARRALGADCGVIQGDIRRHSFGDADAVVILDVLHYMNDAAQRDVLRRVRATLPLGGLLLLRIGDAAGGLRFRVGQWVDQTVMLLRGHAWVRTYCRSLAEWQSLLADCGFESCTIPMSSGTPFANVLLVATAIAVSA